MEESLQRIEKILAIILLHDMKDAPQTEKVLTLSRAGLPNADIATLLGTSSAVVTQQLYAKRKEKVGKRKIKKPRTKRG